MRKIFFVAYLRQNTYLQTTFHAGSLHPSHLCGRVMKVLNFILTFKNPHNKVDFGRVLFLVQAFFKKHNFTVSLTFHFAERLLQAVNTIPASFLKFIQNILNVFTLFNFALVNY